MDLNFQAKVVSSGPVARLDGNTITVTNNHAFRVAGGSLLQVVGDFLSLNNGSVLQALNGSVMTGSRILFTMAADGLLFRPVAVVDRRFQTPSVAIGLSAVLGVLWYLCYWLYKHKVFIKV